MQSFAENHKQAKNASMILENITIRGTENKDLIAIFNSKKLVYQAPFSIPGEFANTWMVQSLSQQGFTKKKKRLCTPMN